ncbi:MAG TPA: efflux RND transporter periplasmic adaptor subunit [Spirochaetota bacterium]|nr:efflux RND transporter periplasmic adaptor subunit [Spirochaetota bacterium]
MKIKRILILLFISMLIFNCKKGSDNTKRPNIKSLDNVETIFAVTTTKTVKGEINNYIELNGEIKTRVEVDVYPDTMGKLARLYVNVGDYVQKGSVIAEVDPSRPGMNYELSPVKATISGTVTAIPFQIGSTVTQQTGIVKIGDLTDIKIISYVSEKYLSKIKVGLPVIIKLEAYPSESFKGVLSETSPVVDPQTRMLEVKTSLLKKDSRVKPGMFAKLKIIIEKKEGIVKIPEECIVKRYGEDFVFVVKDQSYVEKRKVKIGIRIDNKVEIMEGLLPDEEIVFRGQTLLEDKTKIKIVDRIQPLSVTDSIE